MYDWDMGESKWGTLERSLKVKTKQANPLPGPASPFAKVGTQWRVEWRGGGDHAIEKKELFLHLFDPRKMELLGQGNQSPPLVTQVFRDGT